jgi:UDP-sugar transporter A1/2/3
MTSNASNNRIKYFVLVLLTVQNAGLSLLMRYARSEPKERLFLSSTAVITSEAVKTVVSAMMLVKEEGDVAGCYSEPLEIAKTAVPALLYLVQNNLQYIAVSNLDAGRSFVHFVVATSNLFITPVTATFQTMYQLKIVTTAIFSVCLLNKIITPFKWLAIFMLAMGVAMVQVAGMNKQKASFQVDDTLNFGIGIVAVSLACCSSGAAGVYFEKILKGSKVSVWARNLHLGMFSIAIGLVGLMITEDGAKVERDGFFHGYTNVTWCVIESTLRPYTRAQYTTRLHSLTVHSTPPPPSRCVIAIQALGGIVIAMAIKYADNIIKNFATSCSILLSCLFQYFFMDFEITPLFGAGVLVVLFSVGMYAKPAPESPASVVPEVDEPGSTSPREATV